MKLAFVALFVFLLGCTRQAEAAHEGVTLTALLTRTTTYSILVDLLIFSDLLEPLSEALNVTIFAPTNFAFRQTAIELGCSDVSNNNAVSTCFKTLGKTTVATVLQYHVVPTLLPSADVLATTTFTSLLGQTFTRRGTRFIDANDDFTNPMLFPAQLDLRYQYGYVHGISRVLMPVLTSSTPNLAQTLADAGDFEILLFLIDYAGLAQTLLGLKDITVFIPTDRALTKTAQALGCKDTSSVNAVKSCFTGSFSPAQVSFALRYHVTAGVLTSSDLLKTNSLLMSNEVFLYRRLTALVDQEPFLTNAVLANKFQDVRFDNGIAHAITRGLVPFRNLVDSPKACMTFEFPISLADTSFLPIFKIIIGAKKCVAVRSAVEACDLMEREICKNFRGEKFIGFGLSVGRVVAAAKKCTDVVTALRACPQVQ